MKICLRNLFRILIVFNFKTIINCDSGSSVYGANVKRMKGRNHDDHCGLWTRYAPMDICERLPTEEISVAADWPPAQQHAVLNGIRNQHCIICNEQSGTNTDRAVAMDIGGNEVPKKSRPVAVGKGMQLALSAFLLASAQVISAEGVRFADDVDGGNSGNALDRLQENFTAGLAGNDGTTTTTTITTGSAATTTGPSIEDLEKRLQKIKIDKNFHPEVEKSPSERERPEKMQQEIQPNTVINIIRPTVTTLTTTLSTETTNSLSTTSSRTTSTMDSRSTTTEEAKQTTSTTTAETRTSSTLHDTTTSATNPSPSTTSTSSSNTPPPLKEHQNPDGLVDVQHQNPIMDGMNNVGVAVNHIANRGLDVVDKIADNGFELSGPGGTRFGSGGNSGAAGNNRVSAVPPAPSPVTIKIDLQNNAAGSGNASPSVNGKLAEQEKSGGAQKSGGEYDYHDETTDRTTDHRGAYHFANEVATAPDDHRHNDGRRANHYDNDIAGDYHHVNGDYHEGMQDSNGGRHDNYNAGRENHDLPLSNGDIKSLPRFVGGGGGGDYRHDDHGNLPSPPSYASLVAESDASGSSLVEVARYQLPVIGALSEPVIHSGMRQ